MMNENEGLAKWPVLKYSLLKETLETVQLWTQIVGKIRLANTPWINHGWHVTLYVSSRGLTTGSIPCKNGNFQIDFDFINNQLIISTSNGDFKTMVLVSRSVSSFYHELLELLKDMDIPAKIYSKPNEVSNPISFSKDEAHYIYEKKQICNYWQVLVKVNNVFTRFRSEFTGKCSPVHLFWGSFDLAVSRFSGRTAPLYQGSLPSIPLRVMQEAYSHEVSSAGFWAGNESYPHPAFYSYCYPTPPKYKEQRIKPEEAFFNNEMGEFLLNYDVVQQSDDPENTLLQFLRSTYKAAKVAGEWDENLACNLSGFETSAKTY